MRRVHAVDSQSELVSQDHGLATERHEPGRVVPAKLREFRYWRKRLAVPVSGRFLELTLPAAPISLECNGILVHVAKGFDPDLLADILSLLKKG